MKLLYLNIFFVIHLISPSEGKLKIDFYPDVGFCDNRTDWSSKTIDGEFIELDENVYAFNGSINFITNMTAPWRMLVYGEKFERAVWTRRAQKSYDDFCSEIANPISPFYPYFKDFKQCPIGPGDQWLLDKLKFDLNFLVLPDLIYAGRWRIFAHMWSNNYDGTKQFFCYFIDAELFS